MHFVIIAHFLLSLNLLYPTGVNTQTVDLRGYSHFIAGTESAFQKQLWVESD